MNLRELREQALFGLIDGLNGAVGLTIGLLKSHAAATLIFVALLARAGSSSVSMAGAEFQADDSAPNSRVRMGRVAAMGLGYLVSALLPGLGFAVGIRPGVIIFVPATIMILVAVTWARARKNGWLKAAATSVAIFVLAVGAGLLAALVG